MANSPTLCPSWACEAGASLIGIVLANGTVAFSKEAILIDDAFVQAAREGCSLEKRFRFSSTCKRAGCIQWSGDRCGIIDRVILEQELPAPDAATEASRYVESTAWQPPACAIRPQWRWHLQAGDAACRACPEVVTDITPASQTAIGTI